MPTDEGASGDRRADPARAAGTRQRGPDRPSRARALDGGGYPDGLAGDSIPLGSRIIIAADTYRAITSDRPYRAARSHSDAVEELTRCAGSQFDPEVTAVLNGHLYGQRQAGVLGG